VLLLVVLLLALVWQLISGQFFLGLFGATISRRTDPMFYWLMVGGEVFMLVWLLFPSIFHR
jgi:hypothetical protein